MFVNFAAWSAIVLRLINDVGAFLSGQRPAGFLRFGGRVWIFNCPSACWQDSWEQPNHIKQSCHNDASLIGRAKPINQTTQAKTTQAKHRIADCRSDCRPPLPAVLYPIILKRMKPCVVSLLLIVTLLTCPIRCMSCDSYATSLRNSPGMEGQHTTVDPCETQPCCEECRQENLSNSPYPSSQNTDPCKHDCKCKGCVCNGAVLSLVVSFPQPLGVLCWITPTHLVSHSRKTASEILHLYEFGRTIHGIFGRDARIAHHSWQI